MTYLINKTGDFFYEDNRKDTFNSIFYIGPFVTLFFFVVFLMIFGMNLYFVLFFLVNLFFTFKIFYKKNLFERGDLMTKTIKSITFNDNMLELKTFDWFFNKNQLGLELNTKNINFFKRDLFGFKDVLVITFFKDKIEKEVYLIPVFYNEFDEIVSRLSQKISI